MKHLNEYLSVDRRKEILEGIPLPEYAQGAVLFVDISGFTPLTDYLVQTYGSQQGAEILTKYLNEIYTALIAQVHRYQGVVIGFVGDAITCWFQEDSGLRGIACGLVLQTVIKPFSHIRLAEEKRIAISIKVAIATGETRRFRVGNPKIQYLDVLVGSPLKEMAQTEKETQGGEVVICPATLTNLREALILEEERLKIETGERYGVVRGLQKSIIPPAQPWPESVLNASLPLTQVRPWILKPIYNWLSIGQEQFLAQFRPATALFMKFDGLDYERDTAAGQKLDAYLCWVQETIVRYEGSLIQLTVGDKGSFVYATFGAPLAHDDDPQRAVATALALQNHPSQFEFIETTQIGIAYGQMRTGAYGSPTRCTYGVIGNETVLAARFMSIAPSNGIYVDYSTYRRSKEKVKFKMLPPVQVKGRADFVRVYQPTTFREGPTLQDSEQTFQIVGRKEELSLLKERLHQLEDQQGHVLIISGEAGIGKSRLVEEIGHLVKDFGLIGLLGAGQSVEQNTPYLAWKAIFNSYFGLDEVSDPTQRQVKISSYIQRYLPDFLSHLPLLNNLLDVKFPKTDLTTYLAPNLRHQSLLAFLQALFQLWANQKPFVLVLEDAHWLDTLSWDLAVNMGRLLEVTHLPLLLIIITRPVDEISTAKKSLDNLSTLSKTDILALQSLLPNQIVAVFAQRLGLSLEAIPTELATFVQKQTEGNPFFAEESALTLQEQGLITVTPATDVQLGTCTVPPNFEGAVKALPETVQGLILSRVDRLNLQQQLTLKIGSIIGRIFSFELVYHILNQFQPTSIKAVTENLAVLAKFDLTPLESPEPDLKYRFKHIIIQDVIYQTLLFEQRRVLHTRVATWYEQKFISTLPERQTLLASIPPDNASQVAVYPLLVFHYHQAESYLKEWLYVALAGLHAAEQFANIEAIQYLSRALTLTPPDDYQIRYALTLAREKVYDFQGEREVQKTDLDRLNILVDYLADDSKRGHVALRYDNYYYVIAEYEKSIGAAQKAIKWGQKTQNQQLQAEGHLHWGHALWGLGDLDLALNQFDLALTLVEQNSKLKADITRSFGLVYWQKQQTELAQPYYEQSLAITRKIGDIRGESSTLNNLGLLTQYHRNYAKALAYYQQALNRSQSIGNRELETGILMNIGNIYGDQHDYNFALRYYKTALQIAQTIDLRSYQALILINLGDVFNLLGDYVQAQSRFNQALKISQDTQNRYAEMSTLRELSCFFLQLKDFNQALKYAEEFVAIVEEDGKRAEALAVLGLVQSKLEWNQEAKANLQRALSFLSDPYNSQIEWFCEIMIGLAQISLNTQAMAKSLDYTNQVIDAINRTTVKSDIENDIYLMCYELLQTHQDDQALTILEKGYQTVQERAAKIDDPDLKQKYLHQVISNRKIIHLWEAQQL